MLINKNEPTEEEVRAAQAESRRSTAEGEFVIICEDTKRMRGVLSEVNENIIKGNKIIENNNNEIKETNDKILEVKKSLEIVENEFKDFVIEKDSKKLEIDEDIKKKYAQIDTLNSDILELSKKHDSNKFEKAKEITDIEGKKSTLIGEIKKLEITKQESEADARKFEKSIETLKGILEDLEVKKSFNEKTIVSQGDTIVEQDGIISKNNIHIKNQEEIIGNNDVTISILEKNILIKEEEYKTVEKKAFAITDREDKLNQKEEFIKSQYERAGIKWE